MDILFKNTYVRNKALFKELYAYFYFGRPFMIVFHILFALSIPLHVFNYIMYGWDPVHWLVVFLIFYFFLRIPLYFHQVNTVLKRDRELFDGEISISTVVTDQYLESIAPDGTVKLSFDKIKKARQTKNLILLHTKTNLTFIFHKDGFTQGSVDEFKAFIRSKGIKIK